MTKPSKWTSEDKECAKEMAKLGAIEAFQEINNRISNAVLYKIIQMALGWLIIEAAKYLLTHSESLIK